MPFLLKLLVPPIHLNDSGVWNINVVYIYIEFVLVKEDTNWFTYHFAPALFNLQAFLSLIPMGSGHRLSTKWQLAENRPTFTSVKRGNTEEK